MEVFPSVKAYAIWDPGDEDLLQSIVIVATKTSTVEYKREKGHSTGDVWAGNDITSTLKLDLPVLTDQHAPVSFYTNKAID